MSNDRPQDIWIEQCDAAPDISAKFGLKASFVGETLMDSMEATVHYPDFARALLLFVSEVRRTFDPRAMHDHLTRIEREPAEQAAINMEGEDVEFLEDAHEA